LFEAVEQRILYSAETAVLFDAAPALAVEQRTVDAGGEFGSSGAEPGSQSTRTEIVFVDAGVAERERIVDDIRARSWEGARIEVVQLDASASGIDAIGAVLAQHSDVSAVHLISHGSEGQVSLGADVLDFESLLRNATGIKQWAGALADDADLLIYGCDVAGDAQGQGLMQALARLTGADVAASDDLTGAAALGGDWELEFSTGHIEAGVALSQSFQQSYRYTWALIAQESFDTTGALVGSTGGSGWADSWSGDSANVKAGSLRDTTGSLPTSGGHVEITPGLSLSETARNVDQSLGATGTSLWLSFLVQPDNTGTLLAFGGITFGDPGSAVYAGYQGDEFILGTANSVFGIVDTSTLAVSGETAFLVVRVDFLAGNDEVTLYVNPTPGAGTPDSPAPAIAYKSDVDLGTFTQVSVTAGRGLISANAPEVDELRIGTTYLDVAPASIAPTTTGASAAQTYLEDQALDLSNIVVSDVDSVTVTVSLTLSNPSVGTLSTGSHGSATSTFGAGTWTATGAIADVNELLEDVRFVPSPDSNADFTVEVRVSDGLSAPLVSTMAIHGQAVNDAPILAIAGDQTAISDGTTRVIAGFASATPGGGSDESGQSIVISVVGVDDTALFSMQPHIDAAGTLRYQAVAGAAGSAVVTVRARDDGGTSHSGIDTAEVTFTITLSAPPSVNAAPSAISLSASTVAEGIDTTGGYTVGLLSASDADAGDTHTFSIAGGADASRFVIVGNALRIVDGVLDHETRSSYTVAVQATDSGAPPGSATQTFTVSVAASVPASPPSPVTTDSSGGTGTPGSALMATPLSPAPATQSEASAAQSEQDDQQPARKEEGARPAADPAPSLAASTDDEEERAPIVLAEYPLPRIRTAPAFLLAAAAAPEARRDPTQWSAGEAAAMPALPVAGQGAPLEILGASTAGLRNAEWLRQFDDMRRGIDSESQESDQAALASVVMGGGLSVGYVLWLLRGGLLLSTLVSTLPAWAVIDPLPVLSRAKRDDDEDDGDDALERLFARARSALTRGNRRRRGQIPGEKPRYGGEQA